MSDPMTPSRRATPSAHLSAATDELGAFKGLSLGALLGAALWAGLLTLALGCATPHEDILKSLDRASALGLAPERVERPSARLVDGAPWARWRSVEVAR